MRLKEPRKDTLRPKPYPALRADHFSRGAVMPPLQQCVRCGFRAACMRAFAGKQKPSAPGKSTQPPPLADARAAIVRCHGIAIPVRMCGAKMPSMRCGAAADAGAEPARDGRRHGDGQLRWRPEPTARVRRSLCWHYAPPCRCSLSTEPTPFLHGIKPKLLALDETEGNSRRLRAAPGAPAGRRRQDNGSTNCKLYGIVHARLLLI